MISSVRLRLTFWYIGSISLLVLLFAGIAFFGLQAILTRNLDRALYTGGKVLEKSLSEYSLKGAREPAGLSNVSEEQDELVDNDEDELVDGDNDEDELVDGNDEGGLVGDEFDEEVNEIFSGNVVYIQLSSFPDAETSFQIIARTAALEDKSLPFSQDAYRGIKASPYFSETVTGVFPFPLRILSVQAHDGKGRPYILQIARSFQDVQVTLRQLGLIFAFLFPILFAILSVSGYVFMKQSFAPVKKMVAVTRSITVEDLSLRLDQLDSRDEIGELAETFNTMIARLEGSFQQIRQFSGDVSHELKTPLAELQCNAEVALRRERTKEEYQQTIKNVIEDTRQLRNIIENLLFLAQMDAQSVTLAFTPLALNEVFLEVFETTQPLAQKKQVHLTFEEIAPVIINGDHGLLKRLLSNLFTNAVRYTSSGGEITFALQQEDGQAVFRVTDTGVGIPQNALPHIFDRFYRVDRSRSHDTGGSGLGLAIAQKIVEVHGGHISVRSMVGQGTTFRVCLPCSKDDVADVIA